MLFINAGILAFACVKCGNLWPFSRLGFVNALGTGRADANTPTNEIQASAQNTVFAPVFFAPPEFLFTSALPAYVCRDRRAPLCFTTASLIYWLDGMALPMVINVSTNQTLDLIETPLALVQASAVWIAYSETWQFWNVTHICAAVVALVLAGAASLTLTRPGRDSVNA